MKTPKTKAPEVAQAVPVPQPDDPALIDVKRRTRTAAAGREGSRNSLLTLGQLTKRTLQQQWKPSLNMWQTPRKRQMQEQAGRRHSFCISKHPSRRQSSRQ